MPKIKAVNHVAVVVADMEKSLLFWRDALGIQLHELRDVPAEKSQVAFLPVAGAEVELVMPTPTTRVSPNTSPSVDQVCTISVSKWMTSKA
jgi:catechol 2,3-dioxygenase-like lactoylglutathione lyase family enzyme